MSTPSTLADACPGCFPGDHPAVLPWLVQHTGTGSLRAYYWCPVADCGRRWKCWWDARSAEWPVTREEAA